MGYHQAAGNQAQVWRQRHKTGHVITVHHLTSPPTGLNQTTERRKTGKEKEAWKEGGRRKEKGKMTSKDNHILEISVTVRYKYRTD